MGNNDIESSKENGSFIKGFLLGLLLPVLGLIIALVDGRQNVRRGAVKGFLCWFIIPPIIWILEAIIKGIILLLKRNN